MSLPNRFRQRAFLSLNMQTNTRKLVDSTCFHQSTHVNTHAYCAHVVFVVLVSFAQLMLAKVHQETNPHPSILRDGQVLNQANTEYQDTLSRAKEHCSVGPFEVQPHRQCVRQK